MSAPANRNVLWARVVVDALVAGGVRAAVVCPGSRSTPLAFALAERADVRVFSLVDERSAAFFALGRAKATDEPVVVLTTSGTAAANLLPAVVEANYARVPLVAVTADRPPRLRESGANQTIDQLHLYGSHVRAFADLPVPEATERALRHAQATTARTLAAARGLPPGPVHLNVPFEKPLEPTPVPGDVPDGLVERIPSAPAAAPPQMAPARAEDVRAVADAVRAARAGVIVCGPRHPGRDEDYRDAVLELARATRFPVLADPLSGVRFGPRGDGVVVGAYDALLAAGFAVAPPDVVLRFGAFPTSTALAQYLERARGATHVLVGEGGRWRDPLHATTVDVAADATSFARDLADEVGGARADAEWASRWHDAEAIAWKTLATRLAGDPFFEGVVPDLVLDALAGGGTLFASSSMPVRDLDRFGRPRAARLTVLGNRGASGIDGIPSTGLGVASARVNEPTVIVTGDLAFHHDANGLLAARREGVDATVVLVNNDGGGIFETLPVAAYDPPYQRLFRTPLGLDHSHFAKAYGFAHERVATRDELEDALARHVGGAASVIEVASDARANKEARDAASRTLANALADAGVR